MADDDLEGQAEIPISDENTSNEKQFKIGKIHIRPGKPFTLFGDQTHWENCLSAIPTIPEQPRKYIPMPYTFRLPPSTKPTHVKNVVGKCPPFYLLLDHAIAVIWMLFSDENYNESPLGIVQLQWALAFLKTIFLRTGERPKDVNLCIDRIENILIEQYAQLSKQMDKMETIDKAGHYVDGAFGSKTTVIRKFPFSKNYADLITQLGEKRVEEISSITSAQVEEELEDIKKVAGVESIENLDSKAKEKAIKVLKMLYTEQCGKVKETMEKLQSIEDKIKEFDGEQIPCFDID